MEVVIWVFRLGFVNRNIGGFGELGFMGGDEVGCKEFVVVYLFFDFFFDRDLGIKEYFFIVGKIIL